MRSTPPTRLRHSTTNPSLRRMDLFSDAEWAVLSRKSKSHWIGRHNIASVNGMFGAEVRIEEGVAYAYAD
ncbi:hypothetical protein [Mesorhizobium sp. L-8-10]|uniref:hypothetical protein n=1 Tax=Mesorhizobium sp. L-8-10 TaxID=2744523 RepID=UPI001926ED8B|nr:hypothetical protein [Mesorhizobium sp. L-8-10]